MDTCYSEEQKKEIVERLLIYGGYCPECGDFLFSRLMGGNIVQFCINSDCDYSRYYIEPEEKDGKSFEDEWIESFLNEVGRDIESFLNEVGRDTTGNKIYSCSSPDPVGSVTYTRVGTMVVPETGKLQNSAKKKRIQEIQDQYVRKLLEVE